MTEEQTVINNNYTIDCDVLLFVDSNGTYIKDKQKIPSINS